MPREPIPFKAQDPESGRLTRETVIAIHKEHLAGTGWDRIAAEHNTTRHNVLRIVQGRRWRNLHPNISPDLYTNGQPAGHPSDPIAETINRELRLARDRILAALAS